MSTLKVNTVLSADTPTVNITDGLNVTGVSTVATLNTTNLVNSTQLSNRNIIINGAMRIAQRGTSSTENGYGDLDRWKHEYAGTDENPTFAQVSLTTSDTPYTLGITRTAKITNGDQTSDLQASSLINFNQQIEAQNIRNSGWNYTSSSSYITLSFWVRASVEQNYHGFVKTADGTNYIYPYETGTLSANTWTKITKSIPGNSNLTIDDNNASGFQVFPIFFGGTNYTSSSVTNDAWANWSGGSGRSKDQTATWFTTNDATLEITGVQLEVGSVATPFEHKTYAQELNACMRYYEGIYMGQGTALMRTYTNTAGSPSNCTNVEYNFKVEKRAQPTWAVEGNAAWAPANNTTAMSAYPSKSTCMFQRNDTSHQFLSDANGDLCGSFEAEI